MIKKCLLLFLLVVLTGCMDVATTGAQVIYNRQSLTKSFNDQYTNFKVYQALYIDTDQFKNTNISIATYNGEILLTGQVPVALQRRKAEQIVKKLADVKKVYNLINISSPSSTLTRVSDTWITTKVKMKLLASDELDATKIKVVTENGTVYLMGMILINEAKAATDLASHTDGVRKVITAFSYLRVANLKHLA